MKPADLDLADTYDDALAMIFEAANPGDVVILHAEDCDWFEDENGETIWCSCTPIELEVGAKA